MSLVAPDICQRVIGRYLMNWLLLIFLLVLIELGLFFQLGSYLGVWISLAVIVVTALIGVFLVRWQLFRLVFNLAKRTNDGEAMRPILPIVATDGSILLGGVLLIFPGFGTDWLGILLFLPPVHKLIHRYLAPLYKAVDSRQFDSSRFDGPVIDGEYEDLTDRQHASRRHGWSKNSSNHN